MEEVFANTGIQTLCVPLPPNSRFQADEIGRGWQRCACQPDAKKVTYAYIQWQVVAGNAARMFLAVDTTCGDRELGYFCEPEGFVGDFRVTLTGLLNLKGKPLGAPAFEFLIRPPLTGDPKDVHLVVDFGNSRTGALLLEMSGETSPVPQMLPFHLANRWQLDSWQTDGEPGLAASGAWYSARTHWCATPYLSPEVCSKTVYREVRRAGLLHERIENVPEKVSLTPSLFDDLSMARMGPEADLVVGAIRMEGDERTGLSSPKRYLWADDESWLEGANWFMADPSDRFGSAAHAAKLQGPLLRFLPENDADTLLAKADFGEQDLASESPAKPRHAPRTLMVAALYELICQAYAYINSRAYRRATGGASRPRKLRSITLTYPTGMIVQERERLCKQAEKAAAMFHKTLGKHQGAAPLVSLGIDEASAVHLTYIWSELRMLGQDPKLWFSLVGRERAPAGATAAAAPPAAEAGVEPVSPFRQAALRPRRASPAARADQAAGAGDPGQELRIACLDIGGGTSDLMIAKYTCRSGIEDAIQGEVRHRDGISVAGDQLVKRLLERVVVPVFAEAIGLDEGMCQLLFGPEVPRNRALRSLRVGWINRLFVPLAQAYLEAAATTSPAEITHTDSALVAEDVLGSLEAALNRLKGVGYYNIHENLGLVFDPALFEDVVHEVFHDLLFDFCGRIVDHDADIVLLAGLPTKLTVVQDLVRMFLPIAPSRVIPMYKHYAGNWYPYQLGEGRSPGVIVDPKSAVVVGAAINFLAQHGLLPQFRFAMKDTARANAFYWGAMTGAASGISNERLMFRPDSDQAIHEFDTSSQRVLIGRRLGDFEHAEASPAYLLKLETGNRLDRTEVKVRLRRSNHPVTGEEILELESAEGTVAGQPAQKDVNVSLNWRTLADEHFFLDSGGLDNIELLTD
jgi:hypothetical protein